MRVFALGGMLLLTVAIGTSADDAKPAAGDDADNGTSTSTPANDERDRQAQSKSQQEQADDTPEKKLFTGRVVMLRDALKERGVTSFDEFDGQVVLQTPDGELIPIVPDWRGRAFFQDKRLRNRKVDLVGYRRPGVPYLQVLMIFTYDEKGRRMYTDYWCDICSIPMYEIKPCDCCQGPIRLRFQQRPLPDYLADETDGKKTDEPSDAHKHAAEK